MSLKWRTFKWSSEAKDKAQVHVVIIGFSQTDSTDKKIFDGDNVIEAKNINAYLIDGPNFLLKHEAHLYVLNC